MIVYSGMKRITPKCKLFSDVEELENSQYKVTFRVYTETVTTTDIQTNYCIYSNEKDARYMARQFIGEI